MTSQILLCHRKKIPNLQGQSPSLPQELQGQGILWETCLRQILFLPVSSALPASSISPSPALPASSVLPASSASSASDANGASGSGNGSFWASLKQRGWTLYRGEDSYRFCLEVVCGMKSPLKGETEVFGQFKDFFAKASFPNTPSGKALHQFCMEVISDGKFLRKNYLYGLGSQSYGSIVRHWIKHYSEVHLIGHGQLAQSILPWICEGERNLFLFCRDKKRALNSTQHLQRKKTKWKGTLSVCSMEALTNTPSLNQPEKAKRVLMIAAPVEDAFVTSMAYRSFNLILDLRGETSPSLSPSPSPLKPKKGAEAKVVSLGDLFSQFQLSKAKVSQKVQAAQNKIQELAQKRVHQIHARPFGWDDLCG